MFPDVFALIQEGEVRVLRKYKHGESPSSVESSGYSLGWILARLFGEITQPERVRRADCISRLVTEMHRIGHGGAIVIVLSEDTTNCLASIALKYPYHSTSQECVAYVERQLVEAQSYQAIHEPVRRLGVSLNRDRLHREIAGHTAVDGALVIRDDLHVLGFGAKLKVDKTDFEVLVWDVTCQSPPVPTAVAELGGMRHQSAARFVHAHHDCSVIVASQDCRVTLFAWAKKEGQVCAVKGLEHLLHAMRL